MTGPPSPPAASPPTPEDVRAMLAGVMDPELHASIVDLGMVEDVRVDADGRVTVKVA
ncbi:MAG: iron-sulfur cluster assembly protein, partial [Actinomycetota bacterium]